MEYLLQKEEVVRVNSDIDEVEVQIAFREGVKKISLNINNGKTIVYLKDVNKIWYRRGSLTNQEFVESLPSFPIIKNHLNSNINVIQDFLADFFCSKKVLGSYKEEMYINKIQNLSTAIDCNLLVPPSLVTTRKNELANFLNEHKLVIIKPLKHPLSIQYKKKIHTPSSGIMLLNTVDDFPQKFPSVLAQKYIEKDFEVRVFFFFDQLYSFAIFSQEYENSKTDYRDGNPNLVRTINYKLPIKIEAKLKNFIHATTLNTGSIDMIVDKQDKHYFLEVNPSGHFLGLSNNSNLYLEKEIANRLYV